MAKKKIEAEAPEPSAPAPAAARAASAVGEILVAAESFATRWEGADRHFVANETTIRAGHPMLKGIEHLFKSIVPNYEHA